MVGARGAPAHRACTSANSPGVRGLLHEEGPAGSGPEPGLDTNLENLVKATGHKHMSVGS